MAIHKRAISHDYRVIMALFVVHAKSHYATLSIQRKVRDIFLQSSFDSATRYVSFREDNPFNVTIKQCTLVCYKNETAKKSNDAVKI